MNYPLLDNAPDHDSLEFIQYLRDNNRVVHEDDKVIVIENCKYHTVEKPWLTCFSKSHFSAPEFDVFIYVNREYPNWEWLKKAKEKQSVKRFHIHVYKP